MFKYYALHKSAGGNTSDRLAPSGYDRSVGHLVSHPAALDLDRSGRVKSVLRLTKSIRSTNGMNLNSFVETLDSSLLVHTCMYVSIEKNDGMEQGVLQVGHRILDENIGKVPSHSINAAHDGTHDTIRSDYYHPLLPLHRQVPPVSVPTLINHNVPLCDSRQV